MINEDELFLMNVEHVLALEGGYVNHPNDPGGETRFGISKRSYPHLDIRALTRDEAMGIYYRDYWLKYGVQDIDSPALQSVYFDAVVNHGARKAQSFLLQSDGDYKRLLILREAFYRRLAKQSRFRVFLQGWLNRLQRLEEFVLSKVLRRFPSSLE